MPVQDRIINPEPLPDEIPAEISLRPRTLDEYVGQEEMKRNLRVFIEAAKGRSEALDRRRRSPVCRARWDAFGTISRTALSAGTSARMP